MDNTNTILLTESGDLEVYEGKKPEITDNESLSQLRCLNNWLSQHKKVVEIKYSEFVKLTNYLHNEKPGFTYPIDVSDIVTLKPTKILDSFTFSGIDESVYKLQGYFTSPPVDKEDETQEEPQHILWVEVLKMIENNKAAHLMKYFTIKRR